jgi:nitrogenase-associated protein
MAKVIFYEKPGCGGNARPKALLVSSGHELDVRNLLAEPWTAERLQPFFGSRPVAEWFNASAPRVKSGEMISFDALLAWELFAGPLAAFVPANAQSLDAWWSTLRASAA